MVEPPGRIFMGTDPRRLRGKSQGPMRSPSACSDQTSLMQLSVPTALYPQIPAAPHPAGCRRRPMGSMTGGRCHRPGQTISVNADDYTS
jgi:hypothetical protein